MTDFVFLESYDLMKIDEMYYYTGKTVDTRNRKPSFGFQLKLGDDGYLHEGLSYRINEKTIEYEIDKDVLALYNANENYKALEVACTYLKLI